MRSECRRQNIELHHEEQMRNEELIPFVPGRVCISLKQGSAPAAEPVVEIGDFVVKGQLIGKSTGEASVPVYASMSGRVEDLFFRRISPYEQAGYVVIQGDETVSVPGHFLENDRNTHRWLKNMGIISPMGERPPLVRRLFKAEPIKELLLAAFDVEPMVYAEYRLLMECPSKILLGAGALASLYGFEQLSVYVSHDEIRYVLENAARKYEKALAPLKIFRFYKVSEDMYARSCLIHRTVEGALWCLATELCAVYDGFYDHKPMLGRNITVTGAVKYPKNLWIPNGTRFGDVLEFCGGLMGEYSYVNLKILQDRRLHVVEGGPLGGHSVDIREACTNLATTAIMVLPVPAVKERVCMECMECCRICPVGIRPIQVAEALKKAPGLCSLLDVHRCVSCGWCSYICPSGQRLKEKVIAAKKTCGGNIHGGNVHDRKWERKDGDKKENGKASGVYIELDENMAENLESLVDEESHSGPYIHARLQTDEIRKKKRMVLGVMAMLYFFAYAADLMLAPWIVSVGWMLVFVYMVYSDMAAPWGTMLYLLSYGMAALLLGESGQGLSLWALGADMWTPMVFFCAVFLVNDYGNGGKNTPLHRLFAVFSGILGGLLAMLFSTALGVLLGVLVMGILVRAWMRWYFGKLAL